MACSASSRRSANVSSVVQTHCVQMQRSLDKYVGILCEARKKKGMTEQQARDSLQDMNVYGTLMVLAGDADGMVSGATSTTANTIRPALQVSDTMSSAQAYFVMSCMNTQAAPHEITFCFVAVHCMAPLALLTAMPNPTSTSCWGL